MNVVDSSAWLEYFADTPGAKRFAAAIEATEDLIVPAISLYEVFKRILPQRGEGEGLQDLTADLALAAAKTSVQERLPMADSIILATARTFDATLWSQDADFASIPGVKYFPK